jgi:hypothetical protein
MLTEVFGIFREICENDIKMCKDVINSKEPGKRKMVRFCGEDNELLVSIKGSEFLD